MWFPNDVCVDASFEETSHSFKRVFVVWKEFNFTNVVANVGLCGDSAVARLDRRISHEVRRVLFEIALRPASSMIMSPRRSNAPMMG
jgi:hypothetical protein